MRYYGSYPHGYNDRVFFYSAMGGTRGGKRGSYTIIERSHSPKQTTHPGRKDKKVKVRTVKTNGDAMYAGLGGFYRVGWDQSISSTNMINDSSLKNWAKEIEKDAAIEFAESWGLKYVVLDEVRKPSVDQCMYFTHSLFAHKFHWSPEPPTNHAVGDAEFQWKGDEQFDYKDFGARMAKAPRRNEFRSLWTSAAVKGAAPASNTANSSAKQTTAKA
ncbi:hypothetical protein AGDE_08023 [Angomonas deanei]|nr:hypothetical protein AGDE_08023 [Angomonas deanei]|eukprot:EPY34069.1 hypothetical protein AGDE_08023 [Angomonas deanei]